MHIILGNILATHSLIPARCQTYNSHPTFYFCYTLLQLLVFIVNFHRLWLKGRNFCYFIAIDPILAQHLTQLFLSLVRGERPQLFLLTVLSELCKSRRWSTLHA